MTEYEKGFKDGYAKSQAEYKRKQWIKTALLDAQMLQGSGDMNSLPSMKELLFMQKSFLSLRPFGV